MFRQLANSGRTRQLAPAAALLLAASAALWMAVDLGRRVASTCAFRGAAAASCRRIAVSQTPPIACSRPGKGAAFCGDLRE
jgi:hypothetical protein